MVSAEKMNSETQGNEKISKILMVVNLRVGEGGGKSSCSSNLMRPGLVSSATVDTKEGVELI